MRRGRKRADEALPDPKDRLPALRLFSEVVPKVQGWLTKGSPVRALLAEVEPPSR